MAKKIVLAGACRTAIGTMGGELSTVPAPELGAIVIKEALKRAGVAPEAVDQVYMGCVIQAGQGQNVARQNPPYLNRSESLPVQRRLYMPVRVYYLRVFFLRPRGTCLYLP